MLKGLFIIRMKLMDQHYQPAKIEAETQKYWQENQSFTVKEDPNKEKFYCLAMFPYPSGRLHMGHVRNYSLADVIARYQRMCGKNVLQPMGWDAFGLPAENAAIKHKVPPAKWTYENIESMRKQFVQLGFAYDWQREFATCDPTYYRWEQWFFIQLYNKGLVYKKNAVVNWDPIDQTVLANEQVVDGRGWRSGAPVERREIPQWFIKITAYADDLLKDLDTLDGWPEQVRTMQRNWIGRSEGVTIQFALQDHDDTIEVYTTRPDTLMGATYMAIAAEHPLAKLAAESNPTLKTFIDECRSIKTSEAEIATMEKRGVDTGLSVIHPINGKQLPVWIANFVLMEYGTGAVVAVPAHDQRDFEFAQKYSIPIEQVLKPLHDEKFDIEKEAFCGYGILINSDQFDGKTSKEGFDAIADFLEKNKCGSRQTHYRIRDWGVSRQRYWGAPIPFINCGSCGAVPVPEDQLPVILPENIEFSGANSPLASMDEFVNVPCPTCKKPAKRETDTFDTFMESSWYYMRYASFDQDKAILDERANYWTPVDQYVGGIEHAVMHLLYARFFHKVLRDAGFVNSDEPFKRLLTQGMVLKDGAKMSKSKGNIVDPNGLIEKYGADTVRLFTLFAAPPEQSLEWSDSGVEGAFRYLNRFYNFSQQCEFIKVFNHAKAKNTFECINWENASSKQLDARREVHEILQQALYDYERQQFNTVVSGCMKLLNVISKLPLNHDQDNAVEKHIAYEGVDILLRLLAPIVPHITHHLWHTLGFEGDVIDAELPKVETAALKTPSITMVVQVNGKLRGHVSVPSEADKSKIEQIALADPKIQAFLQNKICKRVIVVPNKLINIVIGD